MWDLNDGNWSKNYLFLEYTQAGNGKEKKGESMKGMMSKMVLALTLSPIGLSAMAAPIDPAIRDCREKVRVQNQQIATLKVDAQAARREAQSLRDDNASLSLKVKDLKIDKNSLQDRVQRLREDLQVCEDRRGSSREVDRLRDENEILKREVARLNLQVSDLKDQLEEQNGGGSGQQARTKIIRACTTIQNSYFSNLCIDRALELEVRPNVVIACTEAIQNDHYKVECIEVAARSKANAQQVKACSRTQGGDFWVIRCISEI